jgi:microcystin-dependent protein
MAALWPNSRIPQIDANGDPLVGAKAYFYNVGTTTPQAVYSDSGLSNVRSQPVLTDANGRWPAIFQSTTPGTYRQRATDASDVVIFDDDGISVPQAADYVPPDAGSTDTTLLFATGDIKARHSTGAHAGWVRAAGRTIGSASSGATERANADTSALFQHLWTVDSTLTVSSGRGATAAGDFAANKTIALPDYRERALVGLADMGNSAGTLLSGNTVDNSETTITLGATIGVGTHTLTTPQIPSHTHTGTTSSDGDHSHTVPARTNDTSGGLADGNGGISANVATSTDGAHTHTFTSNASGGGGSHPNVQPSALVTIYIKL